MAIKGKITEKKRFKRMAFLMIVFTVFACLFILYQLSAYNNSVLDIYASQQDAYVQLVVDQINLQSENTDEEIIDNILGSIDSSGNKYWTLSKEQSLLFVKDVSETNRYKGFTTSTYYVSDSAEEFLNEIKINEAVHKIVEINDKDYVASGVLFERNGIDYKICLLTNESYVLDNNNFMQAEITILICVAVILVILLISSMSLSLDIDIRDKDISGLQNRIENQNRLLESLQEKIEFDEEFCARNSIYHKKTIEPFMRKIQQRNIGTVNFAGYEFNDTNDMKLFVRKSQLILDKTVLRFLCDGQHILLCFLSENLENAKQKMELMDMDGAKHYDICECDTEKEDLYTKCKEYLTEMGCLNGGD